jgi:hypothetical protein
MVGSAHPTKLFWKEGGAKSAVLGFPLSCRFLIRGEPPNKNAASGAPFQDRGELGAGSENK